jgi:hypothetical protein
MIASADSTGPPVVTSKATLEAPDRAMLEGLSDDPNDPVYVMWKDTPYAHIMVKVATDK